MTHFSTEIPELDAKGLRQFGLVTGAIIGVLFGILFPYVFDRPWPLWPWVIAGVLGTWGLVLPRTLRPVYRGWMRFGMLLGRITTPIVLTLVFAIVILPASLILRILGKDLLDRKFDDSRSYRKRSKGPSVANMEKPY